MKTLWILYIGVVAGFVILISRLFVIQVFKYEVPNTSNLVKTSVIEPERGSIFDINGLPLSVNSTRYLLYADPSRIEDVKKTVQSIDSILKIGESTLEGLLRKYQDKLWMPIKDNLTINEKSKIEKLNIKGLGFEKKSFRQYPEGSLSAHLVGFLGKTHKGESVGYYGLEGYYEMDLKGIPGILRTETDPLGNPIFVGIQDKIPHVNGRNLYLSVDIHLQLKAKEILINGIKKYGAKEGCIIIADPSTMNITSLVCLPDYDPSEYYVYTEKNYTNIAITQLFEPGSIFKPLIMAAAINEGKVKKEDTYNEIGPITIGEYSIKTWNNSYNGKITMSEIIEKSSNVGMVYVGEKLGRKKILEYLQLYGFGKKTGIDLDGEVSGYIKNSNEWYPIDYATVTFGQGIVVTPIQMLRAFSSIINGGYLLEPHVVNMFEDGGVKKPINKKIIRKVISEKTSREIRQILKKTIENGEAKWQIPDNYTFGGKTGTAQIPIGGTYDPSKTNASFIGFFPVENPKFIVLVTLKEPSTSPWASETAAPMFFDLAHEMILYYNIPPEK